MIRCRDSLPCSQSPLARIPDRCSSLNQIFCLTGRPVFLSRRKLTLLNSTSIKMPGPQVRGTDKAQEFFYFLNCYHVFHSLGEMITLNKNGLHPLLIAPTKINVSFFKKQQKPTSKQMVIKTR